MEKKAIRAEIYIFVKKMLIAKKLKMDRNFKTFMAPEKFSSSFGASPLMNQFYEFFLLMP